MSNFTEFTVGPSGSRLTGLSWWEIRNASLQKVIDGAWRELKRRNALKRDFRVRIHTHDSPTSNSTQGGSVLEFQTTSEFGPGELLFPDWVFGGWWHMGMESWDPFTRELADAGKPPPEDQRAYWKGAHLGIDQRAEYTRLCSSHPERFAGGFMNWGPKGACENFTPMREQCRHAVLVDLTGLGYSGRLKMLAFSGRPLIVADRRWWSWADQKILRWGLHFRVKEDLSDLVEVYDSIMGDLEGATRRAAELRDRCLSEMTFEKACLHAANIIGEGALKRDRIL